MSELSIRKSVEVGAPAATLWRVLTESAFIEQYMFGCYAETDWKPGSPLLWKGAADHKLYVKGDIVAIEPPHRLVYTVIDPNSPIPDIPENYLRMTYELKESGPNACVLEIVQGNFATVANGPARYQDSMGGGDSILTSIRQLAEAEFAKG
ncbi:MAG TPA: SRPBCC domain-containing protein [Acidobacteriaceae bacterium]|jgi:uncharacterized protein YndB with AHSA1/START domain